MGKIIFSVLFFAVVLGLDTIFFLKDSPPFNYFANRQLISDVYFKIPELKNNLNLALFYQWTKEDPIFVSTDLDSDAFSKVVKAMEDEERVFVEALRTGKPIFPIEFLKEVVEVNKRHQKFMSNPSLNSAYDLIVSYQQAVRDYKEAQRELEIVLRDERMVKRNFYWVTKNIATSFQVILKDVEKLGKNALQLEKEVRRREECLKFGKNCLRPALSFLKPVIKKDSNRFAKEDFLPLNILFYNHKDYKSILGPYIVSTPCLGWNEDLTPKAYPFYAIESKEKRNYLVSDERLPLQIAKVATTNYYSRPNPIAQKEVIERGLPFILQSETTNYLCLDTSYQNTLSSLDLFYRKYKKNRLFDITNPNLSKQEINLSKEGETLEKQFFEAEFPSEIDARNLADYYAYAYKIVGKLKLKNLLPIRDQFLYRYLSFDRKLSNYHLVLARALGHFSSLRIRHIIYSLKDTTTIIYAYRSMYGLVYLPFSQSFYRLSEPLAYLEKKRVEGENSKYLTYQDVLKQYPVSEILKWHVDQYQLLQGAYEDYLKKQPKLKESTATYK